MSLLNNKVAIITGGGSGIGKEAALLLARNGAKIVISDINEENASIVVQEIEKNGGEAIALKADTSNPEDSKKTVNLAVEKFGKLDIAVNNAGIASPGIPIAEYPIDFWNKIIGINLSGVFYGMHYQIPEMLRTSKTASIINIASILGSVAFKNAAGYVAAKHGVVGLTKNAAVEYSSKGIRVNAVGPGFIDTPLLKSMSQEAYDQLVGLHPMGRLGKPEEVAELILWLASEKSSFVTGSYYTVDGAYTAQ